jgi:ferritin-like protein
MPGLSETLHEAADELGTETRDMHRALSSLQEELEAVDWYRQRADACTDGDLRKVLLHNMREEVEHTAMLLEWLRRRDALFHKHLKTYLFNELPITEVEKAAESGSDAEVEPTTGGKASDVEPSPERRTPTPPGLTLGSLKPDRR